MLNLSTYLIKEHVGMFKLTDTYDVIDPRTNTKIGEAREEISPLLKALRMLVNKQLLPAKICVYAADSGGRETLQFTLRRRVAIFGGKVHIIDAQGNPMGYLQLKIFSLGGAFRVFTAEGKEVAQVKGDWKGWNFRFLSGDQELGLVTKKWSGLGKELFTSADNYIITINDSPSPALCLLFLAAGLAIDTVLKEKK